MKVHQILRQKSRSAVRVAKKIGRTLATEGVRPALSVVRTAFREYTPDGRRKLTATSEFDRQHGVQTSGVVRIASMQISSPNYVYGTYYKPTKADAFVDAMNRLDVRHEEFTFIDYGSGKGLILLLASRFPFRKIVGVEFARDLHEIATRNIENGLISDRKCLEVTSVCADAAEFQPPSGPLLCYFYDPFELPVLTQVMARLADSWRNEPRAMVVLYHGAGRDSVLRDIHDKIQSVITRNGIFEKTNDWADGAWLVFSAVETSREVSNHRNATVSIP